MLGEGYESENQLELEIESEATVFRGYDLHSFLSIGKILHLEMKCNWLYGCP